MFDVHAAPKGGKGGKFHLRKGELYLKIRGTDETPNYKIRKRVRKIREAIDAYHSLMHKEKCDFTGRKTLIKMDI